jgi:hypothetical protein
MHMSARRSNILRVLILSAASCALAAPSALAGNPLLSGYGGPGQGSQVIIGGGLINPPGGGGSPPAASTASELTAGPAAEGSASGTARSSPPRGTRSAPARGTPKTGPATPGTPASPLPAAADRVASSSGAALGLSGGDALLVVFVLAALAVTAVLTRRFSRPMPEEDRRLKG